MLYKKVNVIPMSWAGLPYMVGVVRCACFTSTGCVVGFPVSKEMNIPDIFSREPESARGIFLPKF